MVVNKVGRGLMRKRVNKPLAPKKKPARPLPLSGSERTFSWDPWGRSGVNHDNCYDYAFGSFSNRRASKSVPGDRSGVGSNGMTFKNFLKYYYY